MRLLLLSLSVLAALLPLGACLGIGTAAIPHKGVIPEDNRAFGFTRSALPLSTAQWPPPKPAGGPWKRHTIPHATRLLYSDQDYQRRPGRYRDRSDRGDGRLTATGYDGVAAAEARSLVPRQTVVPSPPPVPEPPMNMTPKSCDPAWTEGVG